MALVLKMCISKVLFINYYVITGVCQDSVNGRLWTYGNSHIGEWVYGGYPSCTQVSQQLRTLPSSQCSG